MNKILGKPDGERERKTQTYKFGGRVFFLLLLVIVAFLVSVDVYGIYVHAASAFALHMGRY